MITDWPATAVIKGLDLECKMLEDDLEFHRLSFPDEALSIMCFRQFVRMAKFGEAMQCVKVLPPDHVEFYKETIVRLIEANELPRSAMEQFDHIFNLIS
jgi:hypothetical protein